MKAPTKARQPVLLTAYRSGLEEKMGDQLKAAGVPFRFEAEKLAYVVPARNAKYTPDFLLTKLDGSTMYIETKGRFGGGNPKFRGTGNKSSAEERQKMILVKEQHPDLDIRFVFHKASNAIYKGSLTSYAKWADSHGFLWADKGKFPEAWMKELIHG